MSRDNNSRNRDIQPESGISGFSARYAAITKALGLRDADVSRASGIPTSTLSRYRNGGAPRAEHIVPLADALRVSARDLLEGGNEDDLPASHPGFQGSNPDRYADSVEVASIDLRFGLGGVFMDQDIVEQQAEKLAFPRTWLRQITTSAPEHLYWARGQGDSMEPKISEGDIILIDRSQQTPSFGDLYWAIAYGQTGMIKRLRPMPDGSVKILSDNPNVPPETAYEGELHIFGRVVAVVKRT